MRVLTIAGTRPELVRLSKLVGILDESCDHTFVHTGQNAHPGLRDVFYDKLGLRRPDRSLELSEDGFALRVGAVIAAADTLVDELRPDRLVLLGDTDSGLAAFVGARRGIPVVHLEAGNRCYDDTVPEEVNRRVIDHTSTALLPYTERSAQNLVREGISRHRVTVIGNPIGEVLEAHADAIGASDVVSRLGLAEGGFFLMTLHRAETVDDPVVLAGVIEAVTAAAKAHAMPIVVPVHPRTADRLARAGIHLDPEHFVVLEPLGFHDFVRLEQAALVVLTDSGTVQEECAILDVRSVTFRDVTERPETIECGSAILAGRTPDGITRSIDLVLSLPTGWAVPTGYQARGVAAAAARVTLGHL